MAWTSDPVLEALLGLGRGVRERVRGGIAAQIEDLARPASQGVTDLQYGIDRLSEDGLVEAVAAAFANLGAVRLLSEGLDEDGIRIGTTTASRHLVMIDPIDGTRGLMHDKRSAFFLAMRAPDVGNASLSTVTHAVLVEIPTTRSTLSDVAAAGPDGFLCGMTEELRDGSSVPLSFRPSRAGSLRHGFATVVRFFAGAAAGLGQVHDDLLRRLHPDDPMAQQDAFEDQFISNGGQMHSLMTGRDRFVADLRPLVRMPCGTALRTSHPYDLGAALIASRAGVILCDAAGGPLDPMLDLRSPVAWVGYANAALRAEVEPHLLTTLRARGLLP